MKSRQSLLLIVLIFLAVFSSDIAAQEPARASYQTASEEQIARLIKKMGEMKNSRHFAKWPAWHW